MKEDFKERSLIKGAAITVWPHKRLEKEGEAGQGCGDQAGGEPFTKERVCICKSKVEKQR